MIQRTAQQTIHTAGGAGPRATRTRTSSRRHALMGLLAAGLFLMSPPASRAADQAKPADDYEPFVVIKAGKIITVADKEIEDGMIVLSGGRIQSVGRNLEYPLNATVIDARDRVVMPGLINPRSRYGLSNYGRGGVHGNISVADEYFPTPEEYEEILGSGYTTLALVPAGGGIPGRAMVVRIAGPEDQRVLQSPSYLRVPANKATLRGALEQAKKEIEKVDKAREEFDKKLAEQKKQQEEQKKQEEQKSKDKAANQPPEKKPDAPPEQAPEPKFEPPPIDPALEVLVDLLQEKPGVFALLELDRASDYLLMCDVLERFKIAHQFYVRNDGESDFGYVARRMGEEKAKVIMLPIVNRVPDSAERTHVVRQLDAAGCTVLLAPGADTPREFQRTLGRVAELVRDGWDREAALKSVTQYPAELLGLSERLGTIEKDKEADLIFLDADPLDPTARVRGVMIAGEMVYPVEDSD